MTSTPTPENSGYLKRLLRGSLFSIINLVVGVVIGFFMAPIFVHSLGDRLNGIWVVASAFTSWYALLDFGMNHAVSRFFTKSFSTGDHKNCNYYATTGFVLFLLLGTAAFCCSLVIGLGASRFLPTVEDIDLVSVVIVLFGLSFALDFPVRAFFGVTTGALRHDLTGVASILFRVIGALQTYVILMFGGKLIPLAIGNIALMLLQVFVYYLLAKHAFPQLDISAKNFQKTHVKSLFGYSVFGFIAHIGDIIIYRVDNLVVAGMLALNAVTPYNTAMILVDNYKSLLMSASNWMVTWLTLLDSKSQREQLIKSMFTGYKFGTYISGFIAFGLIAWGEPFITRWMRLGEMETITPFWIAAIPCLWILTLAASIQAIQEPNIRFLYATSNHHYFALSNILEGLLNLLISIILAAKYGMIGVAAGTLIACFIARGILLPIFVCRLMGVSIFYYYTTFLTYIFRVGIALFIPWFITTKLVAPNYPSLFLTGFLCLISYLPVIYLIGFSRHDRQQIWNFFSRRKK